jgi:hypothetical protein
MIIQLLQVLPFGVDGEFVLSFENLGDVAAEITFDIGVDETSTAPSAPIEYKLDGGDEWGNLADLMDELNGTTGGLGDLVPLLTVDASAAAPTTQKVLWRWPFERGGDAAAIAANDEVDTDLGTASAVLGEGSRTTYILNVTATATQIAP